MSFYRRLTLGRGAPHAIRMQNGTWSSFDAPTLLYGKDSSETFPNSIDDKTFYVP
jgi:hypothetical protein